jgi:hypothetical protein
MVLSSSFIHNLSYQLDLHGFLTNLVVLAFITKLSIQASSAFITLIFINLFG